MSVGHVVVAVTGIIMAGLVAIVWIISEYDARNKRVDGMSEEKEGI